MGWRWLIGLVLLTSACSVDRTPADAPPQDTPTVALELTPLGPSPDKSVAVDPEPVDPEPVDPRWRFYTSDRTTHTSPWFAGSHRVMIGFGCTRAPYYAPDSRCPGREGFHHGIDVAMPCGTRLFSAVRGRVVDPTSPGTPGAAYGPDAFRIRSGDVDVLIGHARKVYVEPGDVVRPRQLIARADDQGAPDGCHLHLEVRRAGGGLAAAVDPSSYLRLR